MNIKRNTILLAVFILMIFPLESRGQSISGIITQAFKAGNAGSLSSHFGETLTINITGDEIQCGKAEAEDKLSVFFGGVNIRSFDIKFEGEKNNSNFLIGTLYTSSGNYRVNLFFKKIEGKNFIHLLRIEKDNGSSL